MKIGIMGAGQLGRMLALAGYELGLHFEFLDPDAQAPAAQLAPLIIGSFDDRSCLARLAHGSELVTYEFENVPLGALDTLARHTAVWPPARALEITQDRLSEKTLLRALQIPTPEFAAVDTLQELHRAVQQIGLPGILKTRRLGYDGRGQYRLHDDADLAPAWQLLGKAPLIYERFIDFSREVSLIAVRSTRGETRFYPLCANTHEAGILRHTIAPYRHARLQQQAEAYLTCLLQHFDYAGVLAVEFFVHRGGLLVNEMAPRVHNSGHWTIEGAGTSQFENHLRAVLGLPLGETTAIGHSAMVNFIGTLPAPADILHLPGTHFHCYGKAPRPNRKLGHCTITASSRDARDRSLRQLLGLLARGTDQAPSWP